MNYKKWTWLFVGTFAGALLVALCLVVSIDPFFHYHRPLPWLYYVLDGRFERYQNDGILRHFAYDAIITGTSMTENFHPSEFDSLFKAKAVKVPFSSATFKEIDYNLKTAYKSGQRIAYIVRSFDPYRLFDDKDALSHDLDAYPVYLYNDAILDDVKYILNEDTLKICFRMLGAKMLHCKEGMTPFDEYANWSSKFKYGREHLLNKEDPLNTPFFFPTEFSTLLAKQLRDNVRQNVLTLVDAHPETTFYCFIPPYSSMYWSSYQECQIESYMAAERLLIEQLLPCNNVKLFSFDLNTELTNNLNNYKDLSHYGEWVNSLILQWMHEGRGLIGKANYLQYLQKKEALLKSYRVH